MKVLLLCDEHYHPGQIVIDGVAPLKDKGFEFDVITNGADFKPEMLKNYPVVLLSKNDDCTAENPVSWKTDEIQQSFVDFVEQGGGLLGVHSAIVAGKNTAKIDKLLGSKFVFHPDFSPVTVQPIKPHPITAGVGMFCEIDEQYQLEFLVDDVDILAASYKAEQGDVSKIAENKSKNATG